MISVSRTQYYHSIDVLFELIKSQTGGRETVFLPFKIEEGKLKSTPPIRWLVANCIKFLNKHFDRYKFLDNPMNLYHSLAVYTNIPRFNYVWRYKVQEQEIWLKEFKNFIKSYDLFIETDCPDLQKSLQDAKDIKRFLDRYKITYSVSFSGSKGFHFLVPSEVFDWLMWKTYDEIAEKNVRNFNRLLIALPVGENGNIVEIKMDKVLLFKTVALRMKTLLSLETLDTSVQDIKRIRKTPYSWDVKSNLISLPLTDEQFENFDKKFCVPEIVLKNGVYKRGMLWRNTHAKKEEKIKLSKQMLSDLGILK